MTSPRFVAVLTFIILIVACVQNGKTFHHHVSNYVCLFILIQHVLCSGQLWIVQKKKYFWENQVLVP